MLTHAFPSVTNMIRLDHTHVFSTFHQYKDVAPRRVKKGLVLTICTALEVHAQLEEEIFYPALRAVSSDPVLLESPGEHDEMRRLIALLRRMEPEAHDYSATLQTLMREVIHHVADEETVLLPLAEELLKDDLGTLGARMNDEAPNSARGAPSGRHRSQHGAGRVRPHPDARLDRHRRDRRLVVAGPASNHTVEGIARTICTPESSPVQLIQGAFNEHEEPSRRSDEANREDGCGARGTHRAQRRPANHLGGRIARGRQAGRPIEDRWQLALRRAPPPGQIPAIELKKETTMTQRRGPSSPGSPSNAPKPKAGTNPDGRTPEELPTDTRAKPPPGKK